MRKQFASYLIKLAEKDKDIMLLAGDVGFSYLEPFKEKLPDQYVNCGLAEQSMVGIATGLALSGKKPWIYSMIPFILFRPYEQIRTACYHNANITIVGIKGGESYGFLGFSHNIVPNEDLSVIRDLPNIEMFAPADKQELEKAMEEINKTDGITYLRI